MARCYYCKSIIFIGGKKQSNLRYCGNSCFLKGQYLLLTEKLPNKVINDQVNAVHQGACPKCNKKSGPVDIHTSYTIWSFILISNLKNDAQVCCKSCGVKAQLAGTVSSFLLGWWSVPLGIVMTPVQTVRNLIALIISPNPFKPSKKLEKLIRFNLGQELYDSKRKESRDSEQQ